MLEITTLTLGQQSTNCYLVSDSDSLETIIIDPADDGTFITEKILEMKLIPTAIILTHAHFDHVLACLELKLNFNLPILMNQHDNFLLAKAKDSAKHWLGITVDPVPPADKFISDGDTIKIGQETLFVIDTPGHTPGSICLSSLPISPSKNQELRTMNYELRTPIIFSGDTLFAGDVGRTDFSYSNPEDLEASLNKLFTLPPETIVYPGHGEITSIGQEKALHTINFSL